MVDIVKLLVDTNFAKNERSANGMLSGKDCFLGGMFRNEHGELVIHEFNLQKMYTLPKDFVSKFKVLKVGDRYKLIKDYI